MSLLEDKQMFKSGGIDVSRFLVLVYIFFIIFFSIICSFSFVFQVYR